MWRRGIKLPERDVLNVLAEAVLSGAPIESGFQVMVNLIIAKAAVKGGLPDHLHGAPPGSRGDRDAEQVAGAYFEMLDKGVPSERAKEVLAGDFKIGKRQVERLIKLGKHWHGDTKGARDQRRKLNEWLSEVDGGVDGYGQVRPASSTPEADDPHPIGLGGLTRAEALQRLAAAINPPRQSD